MKKNIVLISRTTVIFLLISFTSCSVNRAKIDNSLGKYFEENKKELQKQGRYVFDEEFGWVTPTINSKVCVYGITDPNGIVKCGIDQAYNDGKVNWKKPISCHLFPIRVQLSKNKVTEYVNYEPREDLCGAGCKLGKKLKVPVYVFLKEALVRKYGAEFYETLDATAKHVKSAS